MLLAAGELARVLVGVCRQAHAVEQLQALLGGFFLAAAQPLSARWSGFVMVRCGNSSECWNTMPTPVNSFGRLVFRVGDGSAVDHDVTFLERFSALAPLDQGGLPERRMARTPRSLRLFNANLQSVSTWSRHMMRSYGKLFADGQQRAEKLMMSRRHRQDQNSLERPMMSPLERAG